MDGRKMFLCTGSKTGDEICTAAERAERNLKKGRGKESRTAKEQTVRKVGRINDFNCDRR